MNFIDCKIPSKATEIVRILKSNSITNMVRRLNWNLGEFMSLFNVNEKDLFSLAYGPLYLQLESDVVIGVANVPKWNSITLWMETEFSTINDIIETNIGVPETTFIDVSNNQFHDGSWSSFMNTTIKNCTVLKSDISGHSQELNEVGLILENSVGEKILCSQKLLSGVPGHFILSSMESVDKKREEDLLIRRLDL